ncbi:MAG TPA: ribonuclease III, partial [Candidatus Dojkabacteria bacterium]|nr:ribonuclease III [Candidatus Dojkabacteria bacterium]
LNEHKDIKIHNERLEFLGDAVLELIVSDYLFNKFPDRPEGDLTSFRSALVKTESLADTAKKLGVGESLLLSRGEEDTGGRTKDYLLANTFEAIIGAIYIDQGYEKCKEFVYTHLIPKLNDIIKNRSDIDNKTRIQEITQARYKVTPVYEVLNEEGPDHNKKFTIVVKINNKVIGKGVGKSKQKAQEQAALSGIKYLEKEN